MIKKTILKNHILENKALINTDIITELYINYPTNFNYWCQSNNIKPPSIKSAGGFALACMLYNPTYYFKRAECDKIMEKFNLNLNSLIMGFRKVKLINTLKKNQKWMRAISKNSL